MLQTFSRWAATPLRAERLALFLALIFVLLFNLPFWQRMWQIAPPDSAGGVQMLLLAFLLLTAFFTAVLQLLLWPWLFRPLLILLFFGSAAALYFMRQYGVLIDKNMIQNVFQTDPSEVRDLVTLRMVLVLTLLGALPAWLISRLKVAFRSPLRELGVRLVALLISVGVLVGVALAGYQDLAPLLRNNRELRYELVPLNFIQGTRAYLKQHFATPTVIRPQGRDARQAPAWQASPKRNVLVLVVGETARADRFALNGYARDTNPELSRLPDIVNFSQVTSCGTETAVSLPCMFSGMGRENYDATVAKSQENLLDILKHAGLDVLWVNNNSGCKDVCVRVPVDNRASLKTPGVCTADECYDEVMLDGLPQRLATLQRDTVIVLHQKGSHGPAYYKRYPPAFEVFRPVCKTSELQKCSEQAIGNAYDNTIRYTDHFLARTIGLLRAQGGVNSAMLYLSDHGESLGENNLYLHGMPYALAPDTQKHVPMIAWLSPGFAELNKVSTACLKQRAAAPLSQDNYFHSVLGLMGVRTTQYQPTLDLFGACRA